MRVTGSGQQAAGSLPGTVTRHDDCSTADRPQPWARRGGRSNKLEGRGGAAVAGEEGPRPGVPRIIVLDVLSKLAMA